MRWRMAMAFAAITLLAATGVAPKPAGAQDTINPADFTHNVTNPLFPISTLQTLTYEGEEEDADTGETIETSGTMTVLPDQKTVAGVRVQVVRDEAFEDGELIESTLDYYAQHKDGTVYYFGEDVDNYENGAVVNHDGSWLAGQGGALPGIFMPASPKVGDTFDQERAPGIAEDHSTVIEIGLSVTVPAGSFSACIMTEDVDPLDAQAPPENKTYCPSAGLVKETAPDVVSQLVSLTRAPAPAPTSTPTSLARSTPIPAGVPSGITAPATGTGGYRINVTELPMWIARVALIALVGCVVMEFGARRRRT